MTDRQQQQAADHATRNAARAVFEARMGQVRRAMSERSVPQRLGDEAKTRAVTVAEESLEVAQDGKWIIVGTALAILAWLLRRPLVASAHKLADRLFRPEPAKPWVRLRDWIMSKVSS